MSFNVTGATLLADGVEHVVTERGQAGFVLFGPYDEYEAGHYYVTFKVLPDDGGDPGDLVAIVDVAAAEGRTILATGNVFRRRAIENGGTIVLPFELGRTEKLEFRVQSTGRAGLVIRSDRLVARDPDGRARFCPILGLGEQPGSSFVDRFFENIRYVHEHGLEAKIEGGAVAVETDGLNLYIANAEDFQVLDEVFIRNDYRYRLSQEHIVIDVGMNVGFASLFFAGNPLVRKVHSYEPFAQPFARAMANIARNPEVSPRIMLNRFGLSDRDDDVIVNTVEGFTLGMTLKGLDRGNPEAIQVRAASGVLRPLIEDAGVHGWAVVLKLDCEGSEFPIFESLIADGLLDRVDVLMIEWHKEGSPDRSQHDLIQPLLERNFAVFDHTVSSSQIAGMLYAIRRP